MSKPKHAKYTAEDINALLHEMKKLLDVGRIVTAAHNLECVKEPEFDVDDETVQRIEEWAEAVLYAVENTLPGLYYDGARLLKRTMRADS